MHLYFGGKAAGLDATKNKHYKNRNIVVLFMFKMVI